MKQRRLILAVPILTSLGCSPESTTLNIRLSPEAPTTLDTLEADIQGPPGWSATGFSWQVDGEAVEVVAARIPPERTRRDQVWRVTVRGTSGGTTAEGHASVTIQNSPPTAAVSLTPDTPRSNEAVEAQVQTADPDDDPVATSLRWSLSGATTSESGATFAPAGRRGQTLQVEVTPSDGRVDGPPATAEVTLRNALPEVLAAAIQEPVTRASPAASVAQTRDHDGDDVTLTYAWEVDGAPAATTQTLDPSAFSRGQTLTLTVTPNDGREDGAPFTTEPVVVSNAIPTLASASIDPPAPTRLTGATCIPLGFTDPDDDPAAALFVWRLDAMSHGPADGIGFIDGSDLTKGQSLTCEAIPSDGIDTGPPVISDPVVVSNSPPSVEAVRIAPDPPTTADTLSFIPEGVLDPDDDDVIFAVAWYVNDGLVSDAPTLDRGLFRQGDLIRVEITPDDGEDQGAMVSSATAEAQNGKPIVGSVSLAPDPARAEDTLTVSFTAVDPDDDPFLTTLVWRIDGAEVQSGPADTLAPGGHSRGTEVAVEIRVDDGIAGQTLATAGPILIANTPPTLTGATITPAEPTRLTGASCAPNGWSDIDGDPPGYRYAWSINGLPISTTSSTLPADAFERDDFVVCIITPDDGFDLGEPAVADPVLVGNAAPQVLSLSISPATPRVTDVLSASFEVTDADGDAIDISLQWEVNGVVVSEAPTLSAPDFARGDVVGLVLVASDNLDDTEAGPITRTIVNAPPTMNSVVITPADPRSSDAIRAIASAEDPDDDPISFSYRWRANGDTVHLATDDDALPSGLVQRGQNLTVEVTPNDGTGGQSALGAPLLSAAAVLRNGLPSAPSVAILPLQPSSGSDDLRCALLAASTDPDGDPVTYAVSWTRNGAPYPSSGLQGPSTQSITNDTVPSADAPLGSTWTCAMVPNDGIESGPAALASVAVVNPAIGRLRSREDATCGLTPSGQQRCWGHDPSGVHNPTSTPYISHDLGYGARCGVTLGGSLSCEVASGSPLSSPPSGTDFVDVRLGGFHGCARRESGELSCWGDPTLGATNPPAGPWLDVGLGFFFTCGLRSNGSLACWGALGDGNVLTPPSGTFSRISAGPRYACALAASGEVQCWGEDAPAAPPTGQFVEIFTGPQHACALRASGEAVCWGDDSAGQSTPPAAARWRALALGIEHTCGVTQSGDLSCFGSDDLWQRATPDVNLNMVALGPAHACAIDPDTTAPICWGNNSDGQASPPPGIFGVTSVAVGSAHTCVVALGVQVICWGDDSRGQHDVPSGNYQRVDARNDVTCGITTANQLRCWGTSTQGHLSPPAGEFTEVRVGGPFACARRVGGTLACWGTDNSGVITSAPAGPFASLTAGNFYACASRADRTVACWGANTFGEASPPSGIEAVQLAGGTRHTCARTPDGSLSCFGSSGQRRLAAPAGVWQHVSARTDSSCAVRSDGRLRCWGAYVR